MNVRYHRERSGEADDAPATHLLKRSSSAMALQPHRVGSNVAMVGLVAGMVLLTMLTVGCAPDAPPGNGDDDTPTGGLLSQADQQTLRQAATDFKAMLADTGRDNARTAILEQLRHRDDISSVTLCEDGTTIMMQLADGAHVALDTLDHAELTRDPADDQSETPSEMPEPQPIEGESPATTSRAKNEVRMRFSASAMVETPSSRKAIVINTSHPNDPIYAYNIAEMKSLFIDQGWADGNVDLLMREDPDGITPEDVFKLGDYGVILLCGHGWPVTLPSGDWGHFFQIGDNADFEARLGTARAAEYDAWIAEGKMVICASNDPVTGDVIETVAIRSDLWGEQMDALPGSHVHLISCYSRHALEAFSSKGCRDFLGWSGQAGAIGARASMRQLIRNMTAEPPATDMQAYESLDPSYRTHTTSTGVSGLDLLTYFDRAFYLPTWATATLDAGTVPTGTDEITLEFVYDDPLRADVNETISPFDDTHEFEDILPGDMKFKLTARDSAGKLIGVGQQPMTLQVGPNDVDVKFCTTDLDITVNPYPDSGVTVATVEVEPAYVETDLGTIDAFSMSPTDTYEVDDLHSTDVTFTAIARDAAGALLAKSAETFELACDTDAIEIPFGWVTVQSDDLPPDTNVVKVQVTLDDPDLPAIDAFQYGPSDSVTLHGFKLGGLATFHATAENAVGQELQTGSVVHTVTAGENDVAINLFNYGIILEPDTSDVPPDGISACTITVTVRKLQPGDLLVPTGDPVEGKQIELDTTLGTFTTTVPVVTDTNGQAVVQLVSDTEGTAEVRAFNTEDLVEVPSPLEIRFAEQDYGVIFEAIPEAVFYEVGETPDEITLQATARYFLPGDSWPPTGNPVVGKEIEFSINNSAATIEGTNPAVTDANGQASVQLVAIREGGGRATAFIAADSKGNNVYYQFEERDPTAYPGTHRIEGACTPDQQAWGVSVYVDFEKAEPEPVMYHVFGYNFNDPDYYGTSLSVNVRPGDPSRIDAGSTIRYKITGAGGNGCDDDNVANYIDYETNRFAGAIWWITPIY